MSNSNSTIINGTCHECLCALILDTTWISFNCFSNNQTCQMFSRPFSMNSFSLVNNSASSAYFLSLPIFEVSTINTFLSRFTNGLTTRTTTSTSTTGTSSTTTTSRTLTTSSTTTTIAPPSTTMPMNPTTVLWSTTSPTSTAYTYKAYNWTASATGNVSLEFQFQNGPGRWYLDDVSLSHSGTQILVNGGFESGVLTPWKRTTPKGDNCTGQQADVSNRNGSARTGTYFLWDGQVNCYDQVEQTFGVIAGEKYGISLWIRSTKINEPNIYIKISIT